MLAPTVRDDKYRSRSTRRLKEWGLSLSTISCEVARVSLVLRAGWFEPIGNIGRAVFPIFREAIDNTIKHSKASIVELVVQVADDRLRLRELETMAAQPSDQHPVHLDEDAENVTTRSDSDGGSKTS